MGPPGVRLSTLVCVHLIDETGGNTACRLIPLESFSGNVGFESAAGPPSTFTPRFASAVVPPYFCWAGGNERERDALHHLLSISVLTVSAVPAVPAVPGEVIHHLFLPYPPPLFPRFVGNVCF